MSLIKEPLFGNKTLDKGSRNLLKNATPQQIAIYASVVIVLAFLLVLLPFNWLGFIAFNWSQMLLVGVLLVLVSYLVITYSLKNYIYRKIKLIYKSIYQTKVSNKSKSNRIDMNTDIIGEVEQEVTQWADDRKREIEDLKQLEEYRRNFLGDISHELKTPLFTIQGYVHTLLEGGLYDNQINLKYLKKAASNIDRLQTIIEDLDAISKLESGEWVLEMKEFDIKQLTQEVFDELEIVALKKGIHLKFKDGANKGFLVKADRDNIRQVLVNLISNSVKYGNQDGHIKIGFYDMDSYVLVEVADNGIGIPQKHLKHIFDRFYRVDKSRSRSMGGSGLGLSIVKHIIEAHQQTINVRSGEGMGATFGFTLEKVS